MVSGAVRASIARSGDEDTLMGKELPPAQWLRAGPGGVLEFTDSERRPSLEASVRSQLTGWETAVWAPKAVLEAPVPALWWTIALTASLAFMLVVRLALWRGRLTPLSRGEAAQAAPTLGDGTPPPSRKTTLAER